MSRGRSRETKASNSAMLADASHNEIYTDGQRIVMAIREDFEKLKQEFLTQMREINAQIETLNGEVANLREKISALEEKVDEAEAYERRDFLVFSGEDMPVVQTGEKLYCGSMRAGREET